ncbi:hypothetical protein ASE48_08450 [Mycobacterium sp. Root265]|uniref:hypothetical protein n=1 Tax=Mycobacterium sp. Root265 TaxID=1736504 RepID=UPI0007108C6F|nr:hypothetical protein [Mycobacterium sp. Root265]KRD08584.1 hypothetical protein ASE48_08450 [Mycobacterium sp. Root265]
MPDIGRILERDDLVLQTGRDFRWTFKNVDLQKNPVDYPPGDLFFELYTGGEHNCIQQVEILQSDDGEYTLGYNGVASDPIEYYDATETPYDLTIDIRSALENVPAIGAGNVAVSRTGLNPVWNLNFNLSGVSRNEIQELNVYNLLGWLGEQLGEGDMILSYRENDSEPISFESNAAQIQAALEGIPQLGVGNVTVTDVAGSQGERFRIEYVGLLSSRDIDLIEVRAYARNAGDFFGGGTTGNLLTRFSTKTIQNGRRAVLDGRMMDLLTRKINEFFDLFDDKQTLQLEFIITSNTDFTIVCRSVKGYAEVDLLTFDVIFSAAMLTTFFNNQILLVGAITTVTVDQYWNHSYTVEFINAMGNRPHPLLVGDASGLTSDITEVTVVPQIRTSYVERGQRATTLWTFDITGSEAVLKVESEDVDLIGNRTEWQLVFLPDGEPAGGEPITHGVTRVQR